ncbi:MAG: universal stress protein [Burkholderiales bacterium]|nr:universal stress protein [Burkholderiales bacterium]
MRTLLVPTDGSVVALRALRYAIELARGLKDARILLLNVQPELERWYVHGLLNPEAVAHLRAEGENESAEARALLGQTNLLHDFEVMYGPPAAVIVRVANEQRCDAIIMGTRGLSDVASAFLGSTAHGVIQLAEVPVTLVK